MSPASVAVARAVGSRRALARPASPAEVAAWDGLVTQFANHRLMHRSAWMRSLEAAGLGRAAYVVFETDGDVVGCLPGLLRQLGPLRLFGSPLEGWQTVSLGPAYDPERLTTAEMMSVLRPFLERHYDVDHVELMTPDLDPAAMTAAGFDGEPVFTYRARLDPDAPAATLRAFKESARRNVRRAERLGLRVQFEEEETFLDEHFSQVREVYARNGFALPFTRARMRECFRHMRAAGHLLAVSVRLPGTGTPVATGMFLQDGRELLLWTWAHRTRYRWYRATELMTWSVMQRAMAAGCTTFDLMGDGAFKAKFGAEPDSTKRRWVRSRYRWLVPARGAAKGLYHWQQAARGRLLRWVLALTGTGAGTDRADDPPSAGDAAERTDP